LSPPIIALDDVCVGYKPGCPVLRGITLRIDNDERIALVGANGNGKSTLVKLIAGRLAPMSGQMTSAQKLEVGYFAQHQLDELRDNDSAYAHLRGMMAGAAEANLRARAAAIGFPERLADTPARELSGGEKARLLLGLATLRGPHLVILDEPTNHLDIDTRAALITAINAYPGAVILVSHDRHLLDACADRLLLVADGRVVPFDGDLEDYRKLVLAERETDRDRNGDLRNNARERTRRPDIRRAAAQKRVELAPLRRRIADAEGEITRLQAQIMQIDDVLAQAELFAREPTKAAGLAKVRAEHAKALAKAEEAWLAASVALEQSTA
jgi:ATP-binding cassette, subfamily F, member 3